MQNQILILAGSAAFMFLVIGILSIIAYYYTLDGIKAKTVGDGQHGTARFADKKEIKKAYTEIEFDVENWRQGNNLPRDENGNLIQGIIVGYIRKGNKIKALSDTNDVHCLMIGAAGAGKTGCFLYPNLEFACAGGMSFITTDTKGDLARHYASVAKECYGYNISVIDLRNPTRSDGNNLLHLVNKYMDKYKKDNNDITSKAKAEKYAKIISKTIINAGADAASYGQNTFFYDAAEGMLASVILLISEYINPIKIENEEIDARHIISVFKIIQDLMAPSNVKGKNQLQMIIDKLPDDHKTKWFAGAAINSAEQAMMSVMSTVLSRLNGFIDTEIEQILCFNSSMDAEKFCYEKSAVFIILPEEDTTKYFMAGLFLQQFYREMLMIADENGGKLPNRVMIYADEIGTMPKIESFEMMLSAGRSRKISVVPIIQSFAQIEKNYGKEGCEIIKDNCQLTLFGGFAPNSEAAEVLSKALGSKTIMSGSISRGKNDPSQSLQMIERQLITSDELKTLPKENFIVMKTGEHPMRVKLPLFFKWNITFDSIYETKERTDREIYYADKYELEENVMIKHHVEDLSGNVENSDEGERNGNIVTDKFEKESKKISKEKSVLRT